MFISKIMLYCAPAIKEIATICITAGRLTKKVADHNGQRVAFSVVIPTEYERKRQGGNESINHISAVR